MGVLLYGPLVAVAWLKIGPTAGIVATVIFSLATFIHMQPGGQQLLGRGAGVWHSRSRTDDDA